MERILLTVIVGLVLFASEILVSGILIEDLVILTLNT